MAGIVGIACCNRQYDIEKMLSAIKHRGPAGKAIVDFKKENATIGVIWPYAQPEVEKLLAEKKTAADIIGKGQFAEAQVTENGIALSRDPLGAVPIYTGITGDGEFCFASEVKALQLVSNQIIEVPPGVTSDLKHINVLPPQKPEPFLTEAPDKIAGNLYIKLDYAVKDFLGKGAVVGSLLSGGLDSSVICALVRPYVAKFHTFSVGMKDSPDIIFSRQVADVLKTDHHELVVDCQQLMKVMPEVIWSVESFDARLIRSSLMNYLVGKLSSEYVNAVFSGEASDELFAGYDNLKDFSLVDLHAELLDIQERLHNTAFQRVDRCSSGHGIVAYLPFADPDVVRYARRIPAQYLIKDGISKWVLRYALRDKLPDEVLWRDKSKFWQGSGINDLFARIAEESITDIQFNKEKVIKNGWTLNSKEELMYYRIFKERFGEITALDWMGRTRGT